MRWCGVFPLSLVLVACAHSPRVLTVAEARDAAKSDREQRVMVVGFYVHHFEGDTIEPHPGEQDDGIPLALQRPVTTSTREVPDLRITTGKRFDQKRVIITGRLKRGTWSGALGVWSDRIYLVVEDIQGAEQGARANTLTGPAIFEGASPLDRTATVEDFGSPARARGSSLTLGKSDHERR